MKSFFGILLSASTLLASPVWAQTPRAERSHAQRVEARSQHFDFRDENVQGGVVRPTEATSLGNRHLQGISLLRIRQHFVQEINETVENL
ncbi:MAG: hypothetical protein U0324_07945 [Polyangiales bacterium]